jgi:hypothetical protein
MQTPRRTYATELSDDELLLLDFLFDKSLSFHHLRRDDYSLHMNCQYSHGLTDQELKGTLESLVDRGLVRSRIGKVWQEISGTHNDSCIYSMSETGGRQWELERLADWDRFVVSSRPALPANIRGMIRIVCRSEQVGRLCLGAMFASGLVSPIDRICVRTVWNARLLPWKTFDRVVTVRCKTSNGIFSQQDPVHWDVYNASRCWWRDVSELDSLTVG